MDFSNYGKKIVVETPEAYVQAIKDGYSIGISIRNMSFKDVFKYLEERKDQDDDILFEYAFLLRDGLGTEKNETAANKIIKELAKKNHISALNLAGVIYYDKGDYDKAEKYWEKAAKAGHPGAMVNIGKLYEEGDEYVEAYHWFKKAADSNSALGIYYLGTAYEEGYNKDAFEEPDIEKAVACYKKAADLGLVDAIYRYGYCYFAGVGVEKDLKVAVEWMKKAAIRNYSYAQCGLAYIYESNPDIFPDITRDEIITWYYKAAINGDNDANDWLNSHIDEFKEWAKAHQKK